MDRISFFEFRSLFAQYSKMSNTNISILSPIIYSYEDDFFQACYLYLKHGEVSSLSYKEYSLEDIVEGMHTTYIEGLVILHNIKQDYNNARYIFRPRRIE